MGSKGDMQTSVHHSYWLKHLVDAARGRVPTVTGFGVTKADFFVLAAGEKATRIIKESDALNYDAIKAEYEAMHGAVSEYDDQLAKGEMDREEEDTEFSKEFQKN